MYNTDNDALHSPYTKDLYNDKFYNLLTRQTPWN